MKAIPRTFVYRLLCLLAAGLLGGSLASAQDVTLNVGDEAPRFEALDEQGETWNSEDIVGENILVLYFYPAAMTGGCTKQACAFRDHRSALTELGAEVVGISGDRPDGLLVFKRSNNLNFPLLSDTDGSVSRKFGVPVREGGSIQRTVDGEEVTFTRDVTSSRWTFIIDRDGKIAYKNSEVNPERDSEEVIEAIEQMLTE